ncbi:exonuclease 1 [Skeletonema marinoi]|uniref:Exonuclease 1 n=1 Tax=Skeletonema marinoi TaxID=267567 RepID=A0AAD8Y6W0_9STRA|nr:exonuclease 1 [Skeletonema marinoi]
MGVKGLLPCLQSITRLVSLERYRGLTVAVDAMSWLHKGVFACDVKALAKSQRDRSEESSSTPPSVDMKCINFTMRKAESLRANFGMEVILVIDGDSLPCKKEENEKRRAERDNAFQKAVAAEQGGDSRAARRFYAQSCSVTHKIRYELIKACKQAGVAFLVAPYEADAQMARMAHTGMVDLVITEDSDTLVYGCPRVLFKIDFDTNQGQEIQVMRDLGKNESPSFRNWTHDMFVFMCILSGCDYCDGIPGIGIKLAHKIVRVHRTPSKIFTALRVAGRMTRDFEDTFWIAFRTFRHQRVYCTSKQKIETLWPIAGSNHNADPNEVWPFLGGHIDPRIASRIADGTLHPATKKDWSSALRQKHKVGDRHSNENSVGEIHHRKSNRNEARRDRRSASDGKENIWHSLVYGSIDDVPRANDCNQQSKEVERTKNDMFSFFPTKGKKGDRDDRKKMNRGDKTDDVRPPLTEIYLGGLDSGNSTSKNKSKYIPPTSHKDVPIHFHEYSSRLVGKSFKPMSRKRRKETNYGSKSSRCVQKIWEKSKTQTHRADSRDVADTTVAPVDNGEKAKEDQGVSLFQKSTAVANQQRPDHDDYESGHCWGYLDSQSYVADHSSQTHHQQQRPSSSSFVDDVQHKQSQFFDCAGHDSSTHHQSSSSLFGYDNQTQPIHSDSSFTGAYTTVTAEPQDLFSTRPKEFYDNNFFAEDFSIGATATTCERNYWEDASYISKHDPIEPTLFQPTRHPVPFDSHFDSSFNAQVGIGCERFDGFGNENVEVYEEDMFSNFQVTENTHVCREEEYSHIDDGLLSDLAIMQQM